MSHAHNPTFTVIIPTRERHDTLEWALRSCTQQDYDNLRIIVSDNFSQDRTRDIIQANRDPRIVYLNTGKRVGMSANWEFALSNVDEGYVCFIGDDDGFLPKAINHLSKIIISGDCVDAIGWRTAYYYWPDYPHSERRNVLTVPLQTGITRPDVRESLRKSITFASDGTPLPCIYHGFVHTQIIQGIKQKTGRFFNSMIPDVYSAIVFGNAVRKFCYSRTPYTVAGISRHSTGHAMAYANVDSKVAQKFLSENEIAFHAKFVISANTPILVAEAFTQAQELSLMPPDLHLDIRQMIRVVLRQTDGQNDQVYSSALNVVRTVGHRHGLDEFATEAIRDFKRMPETDERKSMGYDVAHHQIDIDCRRFGVQNVEDAVRLCASVLDANGFQRLKFLDVVGTGRITAKLFFVSLIKRRLGRAIISWKRRR
jgi:glycosyltransferase involved in cell wall biosynthesis